MKQTYFTESLIFLISPQKYLRNINNKTIEYSEIQKTKQKTSQFPVSKTLFY